MMMKLSFGVWQLLFVVVVVVASCRSIPTVSASDSFGSKFVTHVRRVLNFSSTFGSVTANSRTPYDRIMGHPVFQVTTPWGAPYMNFEKVDAADVAAANGRRGSGSSSADVMGPESESRPVTLFYMDYEDAIQMHEEMKQMSNMQNTDIRLTVTSLGKAIRQSSNYGNGLVTGTPIDDLTGNLKSPNDGGSLRYKIVPSKKQLFYAARCNVGRERVGLFGTPLDESLTYVENNQVVHNENLERRRDKKERRRKDSANLTPAQLASKDMEGYTGIPVFYAPQLKRVHPLPKRLLNGGGASRKEEKPFFFSYEDLQRAWTTMRGRNSNNKKIPPHPPSVEVFNLMDVLTSMERQEWKKTHHPWLWKQPMTSVKTMLSSKNNDTSNELNSITFIPPSNCVQYKEQISARGNGKARLRPMR